MNNQSYNARTAWSSMCESVAASGINMAAVLACADLNAKTSISGVPENGHLLIFAAGGRKFWQALITRGSEAPGHQLPDAKELNNHCIDDYSAKVVSAAFREHFSNYSVTQLYPGESPVFLSALGEYLNWSQASPLGLGINPEFGLWFAYRALLWTDAPIVASPIRPLPASPCASCVATPCVSSCPAGAVSISQNFDLKACANFRLADQSPCIDRCLARLSCPQAEDSRHTIRQHQYHQLRSLTGIRNWIENNA